MQKGKKQNLKPLCRCQIGKINKQKIGLYIAGTELLVPLKDIDYSATINNNIANVTLTQTYSNIYEKFIETEYLFPISERSCFTNFEAEYQGKIIKGEIKPKEIAKEEYKHHKEKGDLVAYSEIKEKTPDIMKIQIGNIEPNTSITIRFTQVEELEITVNKFYRFMIFGTITPRYCPDPFPEEDEMLLSTYPSIPKNSHEAQTWKISVVLSTTAPLLFFESPSHKLISQQNNEKTITQIQIDLAQSNFPNKNFVLLFTTEDFSKPKALIGKSKDSKQLCTMISFVPNFSNDALQEAQKNTQKGNYEDFDVDMAKSRGDFIFILDRSGSMSGSRISMAKKGLIYFLLSLPSHSIFNIISFGDGFESYFPQSQPFTEESSKKVLADIEKIKADMGGTEIYKPLAQIFKEKPTKNYPRQIFLLTDGDVTNAQKIIDLIETNSRSTRVHTIGIGEGCSSFLIREGANKGRGKQIFINDVNKIEEQIIGLLQQTITPFLDSFQFSFDKNIIETVIPSPENIPCLIKNESFTLQAFFKQEIQGNIKSNIKISCFDSKSESNVEQIVDIDTEKQTAESSIQKFATFNLIKDIEGAIKLGEKIENNVYFDRKINPKELIVQLSVKEQILSSETAYICVIKEISDEKSVEKMAKGTEKIIVPSIVSADYSDFSEKIDYPNYNLNFQSSISQPKGRGKQRARKARGGGRGTGILIGGGGLPKPRGMPQMELEEAEEGRSRKPKFGKLRKKA